MAQVPETREEAKKRLIGELEALRLEANLLQEQFGNALCEFITLLAKLEKEYDRNVFDITDRGQ